MDDATVTITIPAKDALVQHIEHLQATLTKRNKQIKELTTALECAKEGIASSDEMRAEYQRGWRDAGAHMANAVTQAMRALSAARNSAVEAYIESTEKEADRG